MYEPQKGYPVIPCMGVYKSNIQYDGSLDKLMFIIVVRGDFQNKEIIGYTWDPTASMSTLKYFLADYSKKKEGVQKLDFIGEFLQANVKHRVFVKLNSIYVEYLPEYANYFGRPLRLKESMYGMTNYGKLFSDELTSLLIDKSGFNQSKFQMSVY